MIHGVPAPHACVGAVGWGANGMASCWWNKDNSSSTGINLIKKETDLVKSSGTMYDGFSNSYVPYEGRWRLRTYLCSSSTAVRCSVGASSNYVDSVFAVSLNTQQNISDQEPNFGGAAKTKIPENTSLCYSFVDADELTKPWSTDAPRTCGGAPTLPTEPATCYLNSGQSLDVNMGMLERADISTSVTPGDKGNVKKTFTVLCTRDAGVTAKIQFNFTAISVNGSQVVSTSTQNLGIALIYNGKVMSPSDSVSEDFSKGYTNVELEFEAVRDTNTPLSNISTGEFTANAVMVMNEQ